MEMICADFLAGANLDNGDPETLLFSITRFFRFLTDSQKQAFLETVFENPHEDTAKNKKKEVCAARSAIL